MSDDFGKSTRYPEIQYPNEKDLAAIYPDHAHLANADYNDLLQAYLRCTTKYFNAFYEPSLLSQ